MILLLLLEVNPSNWETIMNGINASNKNVMLMSLPRIWKYYYAYNDSKGVVILSKDLINIRPITQYLHMTPVFFKHCIFTLKIRWGLYAQHWRTSDFILQALYIQEGDLPRQRLSNIHDELMSYAWLSSYRFISSIFDWNKCAFI